MRLSFSQFETEAGYDYLYFGTLSSPSTHVLDGHRTGQSFTISAPTGFQANPVEIRFTSDEIIVDEGITGTAQICCNNRPDDGSSVWITNNQVMEGYLLSTGDLVRFKNLHWRSTTSLAVTMEPRVTGYHDFELFGRCNALPTPGSYDVRTTGTTGGKTLFLSNSMCPAPGTWYISVVSESGAGHFTI